MTDDELLALIAQETGLPKDDLDPDAQLGTLDISSIDMVSLLFEVEDRYGVEIDPDQLSQDMTLRQLMQKIRDKKEA